VFAPEFIANGIRLIEVPGAKAGKKKTPREFSWGEIQGPIKRTGFVDVCYTHYPFDRPQLNFRPQIFNLPNIETIT
jgi:hypothetical protein